MLTAYGEVEDAVRAIRHGAEYFLTKPVDLQTLAAMLEKCVNNSRLQKNYQYMIERFNDLKEKLVLSPQIWQAINLMSQNADVTVLITGPTGAGKRVVAELIHRESSRKDAPFVDINCAGLSEGLLESELFGHERGAFTDAKTEKKGLMEIAQGGTLFLDEIGEMPLSVQAKILSAIETKSFRRIGATKNLNVNTRVIAATNANLVDKMEKGGFREDLYYRLRTIPIPLPPLRERADDIPLLVEHFIKKFNERYNKKVRSIDPKVMKTFMKYPWPGNVRELERSMEHAFVFVKGPVIFSHYLPEFQDYFQSDPPFIAEIPSLKDKTSVMQALTQTNGNRQDAANLLGISRTSLWRRMKEFGLS
jgi:DNA-binding NtrC family response regulator